MLHSINGQTATPLSPHFAKCALVIMNYYQYQSFFVRTSAYALRPFGDPTLKRTSVTLRTLLADIRFSPDRLEWIEASRSSLK